MRDVCGLLWVAVLGASAAAQGGIFDVEGKRAARAVLTVGDDYPAAGVGGVGGVPESPMLRTLGGVLAVMEGKDLPALYGLQVPITPTVEPKDCTRVCVVHLETPSAFRQVEILRAGSGDVIARDLDPELAAQVVSLRGPKVDELGADWERYAGPYESGRVTEAKGEVFALGRPYFASSFTLDRKTIKARIYPGEDLIFNPSERNLDVEIMAVRLPRGYDPRRPSGLVVWIDPSQGGSPPKVFEEALDALNFVCVGVRNTGNDRHVTDRMQLALDAVATMRRRFHIDAERVYATGVSGGGRISSMLWGCFPDVFRGAVPIVGVSSYEREPTGDGRYWRQNFAKPRGELLKLLQGNRLAAITGEQDGNAKEIRSHCGTFQGDRLHVRLFDYEDMGHEYPTPKRFRDALEWVDEPRREALAKGEVEAKSKLDAFLALRSSGAELTAEDRKLIEEITAIAPWSEPAWKAVELLGLAPPAGLKRPVGP